MAAGLTMPLIASGASLLGGASSGKKESQAQAQAAQAAQTAAAGQTAIDQELIGLYNNLFSEYQSNYEPLISPTTTAGGALLSGTGDQTATVSNTLTDLTSPGAAESYLGLNPNEIQNVISTLTNTGGTNLAAEAPSVESYLTSLMQTGLNPQAVKDYISQAVGAQNTATQNQINTILESPNSVANPSGTVAEIAQQGALGTASSLAQMVPQLLTENQQAQTTGAQGLISTATGVDSEMMSMLEAAAGLQSGTLQSFINNMSTATSTTGNIDSLLQGLITSGNPLASGASSGLSGIGQQYAAAGSQAATNAANLATANPFANFASTVGSFNWSPSSTVTTNPGGGGSSSTTLSGVPYTTG